MVKQRATSLPVREWSIIMLRPQDSAVRERRLSAQGSGARAATPVAREGVRGHTMGKDAGPLRFAVAGCGMIGAVHAQVNSRHPDHFVPALVNPTAAKARRPADRLTRDRAPRPV